MPYLNVMSRIEGRADDTLLFDVGGTEHPSFLFLDAEGEVLGRHDPSDTSVKAFGETGAKVRRSLDLAKKAEAGDEAAGIDLAILRCDLGVHDLFDLEDAIGEAKLTPEQERAVATLRADAAVADMIEVMRKGRDEGARKIAIEEFLALRAKGAHPARAGNRRFYWGLLAIHAVREKDAALLGEAIEGLRPVLPEGDAKRLADLERELEALK